MEREICEESTQTVVGCGKILPHVGKSSDSSIATTQNTSVDEKQHSENTIVSSTPEKTFQPPRRSQSKGHVFPIREEKRKSKNSLDAAVIDHLIAETPKYSSNEDVWVSVTSESQVAKKSSGNRATELPEKYRTLAELFDKMVTSIRLLNLRKKLCSFQNICSLVEVLTRRKFLHSHLRQIMYVFADAIQTEKILVHDEKSLCMKPDMKISLLLEVVEHHQHPDQSKHNSLRHAFHARLLEFINSHSEGCDIPESALLEPLSPVNCAVPTEPLLMQSSVVQPQPDSDDHEHLSIPSHLPNSFRKRFSQKILVPETQESQLLLSPLPLVSMKTTDESNREITLSQKDDTSCSISASITPPSELICTPNRYTVSHLSESTPVKLVSDPNKMMIETPALKTPERSKMASPDKKFVFGTKLLGHSARRSLIYSPSKNDGSADPITCTVEQNRATLYASNQIRATKRYLMEEELGGYPARRLQMLDDNAAGIMNDCNMNKSDITKRQQMLASLPDLFNTIHLIFSSINCSFITKNELMHKIISYNLDIEEPSEVEEQLQLLEELVPDSFCGKTVSSGDFLYFIGKSTDPELVRRKLLEAV